MLKTILILAMGALAYGQQAQPTGSQQLPPGWVDGSQHGGPPSPFFQTDAVGYETHAVEVER